MPLPFERDGASFGEEEGSGGVCGIKGTSGFFLTKAWRRMVTGDWGEVPDPLASHYRILSETLQGGGEPPQ